MREGQRTIKCEHEPERTIQKMLLLAFYLKIV